MEGIISPARIVKGKIKPFITFKTSAPTAAGEEGDIVVVFTSATPDNTPVYFSERSRSSGTVIDANWWGVVSYPYVRVNSYFTNNPPSYPVSRLTIQFEDGVTWEFGTCNRRSSASSGSASSDSYVYHNGEWKLIRDLTEDITIIVERE